MAQTNLAETFLNLLQKSMNNFKQLEKIIANERQALEESGFKGDFFSEIVKLKEAKLEEIANDIKERNLFLVSLDITPNKQGLDNFLAKLNAAEKTQIEKIWLELERVLEKIQTDNLANARLANNAQQHLDLMMQLLHNASSGGVIYQAKGESKNINTRRDLGKA